MSNGSETSGYSPNLYPILAQPVRRPWLVVPSSCVNLEVVPAPDERQRHDELQDVVDLKLELLHGANFDDPAYFGWSGFRQVMTSGICRWR